MKKKLTYILTIVLVSLSILAFSACENRDETEYVTPKAWKEYIVEIEKYLLNNLQSNGNKFNFLSNTNLSSEKVDVSVDFGLNLDLENVDNLLTIEIKNLTANKDLLQFHSDNEYIYLLLYQAKYDKTSKFKFAESPFFDITNLNSAINSFHYYAKFFNIIAENFFTDCNVNAQKTEYVFKFNLKKAFSLENNGIISQIINILPKEDIEWIYSFFGVSNYEELCDFLPEITGEVVLNIKDDKINGISIKNINYNTSNEIMLIDTAIVNCSNEINYDLFDKIPVNDSSYKEIKVGVLTTSGDISVSDSIKRNKIIKYQFELNMNVDILKLLKYNGDLNCLDDKNYFHFRLSHSCDIDCTEFCSVESGNKFNRPQGSILDISFSPKDFGTNKLYLSFSLKSFIGENFLSMFANEQAGIARLVFADYFLITLDTFAFASNYDKNTNIGLKEDLNKNQIDSLNTAKSNAGFDVIIKMLSKINIWNSSAKLSVEELVSIFIADETKQENIVNIFKEIFSFKDIVSDRITFDYKLPQYGDEVSYDIYKETIFMIDENVSEIKQYGDNYLNKASPSLDWSYDNYTTINTNNSTKKIFNIFSDNDEIIYGKDVEISPQELKKISGYIDYSYTDINKNTHNEEVKLSGKAKIIEVLGVDYDNYDYQKVYLKVELPSDWTSLKKLGKYPKFLNDIFYDIVSVDIKMSKLKENGVTLTRTDKENGQEKVSYQLHRESYLSDLKYLDAKLSIEYESGYKKTLALKGKSDALVIFDKLINTDRYILNRLGEIEIKYHYAGLEFEKYIFIQEPKTISIEQRFNGDYEFVKNSSIGINLFNKFQLVAEYSSGIVNLGLNYSNYSIEGVAFNKDGEYWYNVSTLTSSAIIFKREGVFQTEIKAFGISKSVNISIVSDTLQESKYQIDTENNNDKQYYINNSYNLKYKVRNEKHGVNGLDNLRVTVTLQKGYLQNGNIIYNSANDILLTKDARLMNMKFDNISIKQGDTISLPAMISNFKEFRFDIIFNKGGYYQVKVNIGTLINTYKLFVSEDTYQYEFVDVSSSQDTYNSDENYKFEYKLKCISQALIEQSSILNIKLVNDLGVAIHTSYYDITKVSLNGREISNNEKLFLPTTLSEEWLFSIEITFLKKFDANILISLNNYLSATTNLKIL